jgi:hypothetical protein
VVAFWFSGCINLFKFVVCFVVEASRCFMDEEEMKQKRIYRKRFREIYLSLDLRTEFEMEFQLASVGQCFSTLPLTARIISERQSLQLEAAI